MNSRFHHRLFIRAGRFTVIFAVAALATRADAAKVISADATTAPATSLAAFPDVCKTPTPGGPVPLPYPNLPSNPGVILPPLPGNGSLAVASAGAHDSAVAVKSDASKSSNATNSAVVRASTGDLPGVLKNIVSDGVAAVGVTIAGQTVSRSTDLAVRSVGVTVPVVSSSLVGTYACDLVASGTSQVMRRVMMTLVSDGTAVVELLPGTTGQVTETAVGVWTAVGTHAWEIVVFAAGSVRVVNSTTTVSERSGCTGVMTIELVRDAAGSVHYGTAVGEVFLPGDDPLDPQTAPAAVVQGTISQLRRLAE